MPTPTLTNVSPAHRVAGLLLVLAIPACQEDPFALHAAAADNDLEQVERLLSSGADLDRQDGSGYTPLHKALYRHHPTTARYLVEQGADVTIAGFYGVTALHLVEEASTAELLLARGARLDAWSKSRATPLHSAIERELVDVARLLVARGAPLEAEDVNGSRPLHLAAGKGSTEIVRLLLEAGAYADAANAHGFTPIHWAAGNGRREAVLALLDAGATVNMMSANGGTPIDMAAGRGHREVVKILERHEADARY